MALIGTRLSSATVAFIGWFGPRGLASIVLGLVYLDAAGVGDNADTIRYTVIVTVLASIVAHGISATPGIGWYANALSRLPADAKEHEGDGAKPGTPC